MRKQNRIVFDYYYSRKLDDLDIFFCFFQKCAFHGKILVWTKREFDDRSMTASIRFVSRLFRDSRDILLTASRPIVPRSMNRFANAFPFRRRRIGLAISAHPIGISRATPRTATKFILPERLIPKTKGFSWKMSDAFRSLKRLDSFRAYRKNYISRDWKGTTFSRILWNHRRSK